jgi:hypothetical protein
MLKVLGENYYFDLDKIENYINVDPPENFTGISENHISVVKYEMVKILTETVLTENEEIDENLGAKASGLSIPFKIAFNSLLNKKLINKY